MGLWLPKSSFDFGRGTGVDGGRNPALGAGTACHKPTHGKVWTGLPLVGEGGREPSARCRWRGGPDQDWGPFNPLVNEGYTKSAAPAWLSP